MLLMIILRKIFFNATYVSYAVIGGIILNNSATTGVLDYTDLKINNNTENVPLTDEQMPTVNEVNLIE